MKPKWALILVHNPDVRRIDRAFDDFENLLFEEETYHHAYQKRGHNARQGLSEILQMFQKWLFRILRDQLALHRELVPHVEYFFAEPDHGR